MERTRFQWVKPIGLRETGQRGFDIAGKGIHGAGRSECVSSVRIQIECLFEQPHATAKIASRQRNQRGGDRENLRIIAIERQRCARKFEHVGNLRVISMHPSLGYKVPGTPSQLSETQCVPRIESQWLSAGGGSPLPVLPGSSRKSATKHARQDHRLAGSQAAFAALARSRPCAISARSQRPRFRSCDLAVQKCLRRARQNDPPRHDRRLQHRSTVP